MRSCEGCGKRVPQSSYELFDYCALCSKNLCDECMKKGCCGNVPAKSGTDDDTEVDERGDAADDIVRDIGGESGAST